MKRNLLKVSAAAMAAAFALTACGSGSSGTTQTTAAAESGSEASSESAAESTSGAKDTLVVALQQDIVSFDPAFAYDHTTNQVVDQVCESLLKFTADGGLEPMLASDWEAVDSTTYVYQIRDDINFSDGNPMTMDDVLFSVQRHMDAEVASNMAWFYDSVESIEQTGDWEMTVKLAQPDAAWQYAFATTAGCIIEKAYAEENADTLGGPGVAVIGTGPYVYDNWVTGNEITLKSNENYWDSSVTPQIKNIDFQIINDETTLVTALKNEQVDFALEPPTEMLSELKSAGNLAISDIGSWSCLHMAINCQSEYFSDVNVRLAVAYALDKDGLYNSILSEDGEEAINSIPFGSALYGAASDSWSKYAETAFDPKGDLEKAKEYMAKSSYPDGFDCVLYVKNSSVRSSCALYVQSALKEIGINVDVEVVDGSEMSNYQFGTSRDYDLLVINWEADYPDAAANIYPLFYSQNAGEGGANASCYSNAEVDELLQKENASVDLEERTELLQQTLDIVGQECPMITFYYATNRVVMNQNVEYTMSPSYIWNFYIKDVVVK